MRLRRFTIVLGAVAAALAGCESMTEDQCRKADWFERGRNDGGRGEPEAYLERHRKACSKANVVPDDRRWRQGWAEGVRGYCVPRVAWQRGLDDRTYYGACRDHDEAQWLRWYELGKEAGRTKRELDGKQRELDKTEEELKKAEKEEDRKVLREKIRRLDAEIPRLRRLLDVQMRKAPR